MNKWQQISGQYHPPSLQKWFLAIKLCHTYSTRHHCHPNNHPHNYDDCYNDAGSVDRPVQVYVFMIMEVRNGFVTKLDYSFVHDPHSPESTQAHCCGPQSLYTPHCPLRPISISLALFHAMHHETTHLLLVIWILPDL